MNNLFVYGTLMCQDIMLEVTGYRLLSPDSNFEPPFYHSELVSEPSGGTVRGILKGYSRRSVRGEVYPAIVPNEKGMVEGILYKDIPPEAWDRLDEFEGEMYSRQSVQIILPDETIVLAETYVIRPEYIHHLENT